MTTCALATSCMTSYSALLSGGDGMTVLVVASSKGGPGKTMLSSLIIGALAAEGLAVAAIDADPTAGLHRWATTTYEGSPFVCHAEADEERLAHLIGSMATTAA